MRRATVNVGDIFEIHLENNKKAFGQYVFNDIKGPLIQVYKLILPWDETPPIQQIVESGVLINPLYTGLHAAVRTGFWKVIGHSDMTQFTFPGFVSTLVNPQTKKASNWFYWDGNKSTNLGNILPKKYLDKEYLAVYSPYDIPERILTLIKPYEKLITTNSL